MDSYIVKTFVQSDSTPITTVMSEAPQFQTVMQDGLAPITTVVNAPWVSVTSVNGKTGDVVIEVKLGTFEPNHYYEQGTAILYNGYLYYAKQNFNSGTTFNANDWQAPDFDQVQADWNTTTSTAKSFIKNKPTKLSQFDNDLDLISEDDVNDIVKNRIEPLETDVEELQTSIATVSGKVDSTSQTVSNLSTTVTNMKTDGSVTRLGTATVGSEVQPIYLDNGTPATCHVGTSASNVNSSLTRTDVSSHTYVGQYLDLKYGTSTHQIYAGIDGIYTPDYFLQGGSYVVLDVRDGWDLISKTSFSSAKSGTELLSASLIAYPNTSYAYHIEYALRNGTTSNARFYIGIAKGSTTLTTTGCIWKRWGLHDGGFYTDTNSNIGTNSLQDFTLGTYGWSCGQLTIYPSPLEKNYLQFAGKNFNNSTALALPSDDFNYVGTVSITGSVYRIALCSASSSVQATSGELRVYVRRI